MTDDEIARLFAQQSEIVSAQADALGQLTRITEHLQAENDALANALVLLGALLKHRSALDPGDLNRVFTTTMSNLGPRAQLAERIVALIAAWSEDTNTPPADPN
jgi:hypothetical protein